VMFALGLLIAVVAMSAPVAMGGESTFEAVVSPAGEGVIVPAASVPPGAPTPAYEGASWTPTRSDVHLLEGRLPEFLRRAAKQVPPNAGLGLAPTTAQIRDLSARLRQFRRQYIGVTIEGHRRVRMSAFPASGFPEWRERLVVVLGGGCSFWRTDFDVETAQFVGLGCNSPR